METIIVGLIDGIVILLQKVNALKDIAKQSGELTPQQEQALDAKMKSAFESAAWQPSTPP